MWLLQREQFITLFATAFTCISGDEKSVFKSSREMFSLPSPDQPTLSVSDLNSIQYGSCNHGELTTAAIRCESAFFKNLIEKPYSTSCRSLYREMQNCINSKWKSCFPNTTSSHTNVPTAVEVYSESAYCNDGALSLPSLKQPINYCSPEYRKEAKKCLRTYHNMFRRDPQDDDICEELMEARICWHKVQDELCEYESVLKVIIEAMRDAYRCWNPFCIWSRRTKQFFWQKEETTNTYPAMDICSGLPKDCLFNSASGDICIYNQKLQKAPDNTEIVTQTINLQANSMSKFDRNKGRSHWSNKNFQRSLQDASTPSCGIANCYCISKLKVCLTVVLLCVMLML